MCSCLTQLIENIEMTVFLIFIIWITTSSYYNHFVGAENQLDRISQNKDFRNVEAYTTIFLDDEAYSLVSVDKHSKNPSKVLGNGNLRLEGGKLKYHRPNFRLSLAKGTKPALNEIHSGKYIRNKSGHKRRQINNSMKILHKRHYGGLERNYRRTRQQHDNKLQSYRFPLMAPVSNMSNYSSGDELAKTLSKPVNSDGKGGDIGSSYKFLKNSGENPLLKFSPESSGYGHFFRSSTPLGLESSNFKTEMFPNNLDDQNYSNPPLYTSNSREPDRSNLRPAGDYEGPAAAATSAFEITTKVSPTISRMLERAAVIQRSLPPVASRQAKSEKDNEDEGETDDTVINFGGTCDLKRNQTCWVQREVGDVLTLSVKINGSKKPDSYQIRWMKIYHIYEYKKGKPLEIEPAKLPWNMVSGSEGRELRLNPVTNSDMDPNCIVAKVFLLTKHRGKTLFTQLKKLIFRIDSPIIDMGNLYAGEELSINIENFISLPERGNLLFDWCLETKPHQYESLPSNIKISTSGRSVVLKELKKGHMGVLNCVIYSSNRFAVAKRRFNILKIAESVKRRSTVINMKDRTGSQELRRSRQCRHVLRRSQEEAMQRLEEGRRPKSRKKRFKRMNDQEEIDCEHLRKKVYSRWVRSLFGEFTTEDPRLMPVEKLFELSEQGDGTLDKEIPHEVHYVPARIRILRGTAFERSSDHNLTGNCTSNDDCGKDATCVHLKKQNSSGQEGFCYCRPAFYGDGFTCRKIPLSSHREKRLKRNANKDFAVPTHLFYERSKEVLPMITTEIAEENGDFELPLKVLAFEEEESFLISDCIDDKDCSNHASCIQPNNGHPYCKCRPGFRGNGIFCWETIDYVPPDEHFFPEDEIDGRDGSESIVNHSASRTSIPDGLEEE